MLAVRNAGPGHGNNVFPDDDQIRIALTHAKRGLESLASNGLTPVVYERAAMSSGLRGQKEIHYQSWAGEVTIRVPYWPLAPGLANTTSHLVIVNSAMGPGWGHLRFRMPRGDNGGSRWSDWPPRRRSERPVDWESRPEATEPVHESDPLSA